MTCFGLCHSSGTLSTSVWAVATMALVTVPSLTGLFLNIAVFYDVPSCILIDWYEYFTFVGNSAFMS